VNTIMENSSVAELLTAPQDGLCSVELVCLTIISVVTNCVQWKHANEGLTVNNMEELGHPVTGGYKYRDLALQILESETEKCDREFRATRI
jgi:hypothetical protein